MANTLNQQQVDTFFKQQGMPNINGVNGGAEEALAANPQLMASFAKYQVDQGGITDPASVNNINAQYAEATAAKPVTQVMSEQVSNPSVPTQGYLSPHIQTVNNNELIQGQGTQVSSSAAPDYTPISNTQIAPAQTVDSVATVDQNQVLNGVDTNGAAYDAVTTSGSTPQAVAQQGEVHDLSTVQGQLAKLYADAQPGEVPTWAKGAVNNANDAMAARGLGASTIGTTAIAGAIQQSALPIASQDASTYFQMDMTNLNNRQQTELTNVQLRQQALLTDQAADNAALQFNASSEQQTQQFVSNMVATIQSQNAERVNTMNQFNTQTENEFTKIQAQLDDGDNQFNAQMKQTLDTFNAKLDQERKTFNSQMQYAIEQSNVMWRRSVNTSNTASKNAATQVNTQNAFNLSSAALSNLWQEYRDTASWLFTSSENEKDRAFQLAYASNQNDFAASQNGTDWTALLGEAAVKTILS